MDITLETVQAQALQLSAGERERLAELLWLSLPPVPEIEAAWAAELDRREAELQSGAVELLDGEAVLQELKAKYCA